MLDVRPARRDETAAMLPLLRSLYEQFGDGLGPAFEGLLDEYIASDSHAVLVAVADGALVGVLIGSYRLDIDLECRAGFIDALIVHGDYRIRGAGRSLLGAFARWARDKGATVLQVLNCHRKPFEAIGFRERPTRLHQIAVDEALGLFGG